jgi:hypothetical protein
MITYEIRKKEEKSLGIVQTLLGRAAQRFLPTSYTPSGAVPSLLDTWDKVKYSRWIESVKRDFKAGDMVTYKRIPHVLNQCPVFYYITHVQEIHYMAEVDKSVNVPKAITMTAPRSGLYISVTPDELRPLFENEKAHADLRNPSESDTSTKDLV